MDSLEVLGRDRPVLEITPQMIDAGASVLLDFEPETGISYHELADIVFRAMLSKLPDAIRLDNCPNFLC